MESWSDGLSGNAEVLKPAKTYKAKRDENQKLWRQKDDALRMSQPKQNRKRTPTDSANLRSFTGWHESIEPFALDEPWHPSLEANTFHTSPSSTQRHRLRRFSNNQ